MEWRTIFCRGSDRMSPSQTPKTDQDWFAKRSRYRNFLAPQNRSAKRTYFVGRTDHIKRVTEGIMQGGQHVVVYGERGVGKTSLMNIISNRIFLGYPQMKFLKVRCLTGHNFVTIWERAFEDQQWDNDDYIIDDIDSTLDAHLLLKIVTKFGDNVRPIFVFDEFDRISEDTTKLQLAETIKLFSDEAPHTTIIVIGVARTVRELISEHKYYKTGHQTDRDAANVF